MRGDDRERFCGRCEKSVYNLSAMASAEAEALLERTSFGVCVRFYRRADGTVITGDCPVGVRQKRKSLLFAGAALLLSAVSSALGCAPQVGGLTNGDADVSDAAATDAAVRADAGSSTATPVRASGTAMAGTGAALSQPDTAMATTAADTAAARPVASPTLREAAAALVKKALEQATLRAYEAETVVQTTGEPAVVEAVAGGLRAVEPPVVEPQPEPVPHVVMGRIAAPAPKHAPAKAQHRR